MAYSFEIDGRTHQVSILARRPHLVLAVDGRPYRIEDLGAPGTGLISLSIEGERLEGARLVDGHEIVLRAEGASHRITWLDGAEEASGASSHSELRAPMPGAVVEVHAVAGQHLAAGDPILTIESMKLQTVLGAPRGGVLAEVPVAAGELFGKDDILARLEEEEAKDA